MASGINENNRDDDNGCLDDQISCKSRVLQNSLAALFLATCSKGKMVAAKSVNYGGEGNGLHERAVATHQPLHYHKCLIYMFRNNLLLKQFSEHDKFNEGLIHLTGKFNESGASDLLWCKSERASNRLCQRARLAHPIT